MTDGTPVTALLLGGGAPTLTLQSGAFAALHEHGVKFDIVSTAGAGMLIGLLYAAPKGLSPAQALAQTKEMGFHDSIYEHFPDRLQSLPQARPARRRLSPLAAIAAAHGGRSSRGDPAVGRLDGADARHLVSEQPWVAQPRSTSAS